MSALELKRKLLVYKARLTKTVAAHPFWAIAISAFCGAVLITYKTLLILSIAIVLIVGIYLSTASSA